MFVLSISSGRWTLFPRVCFPSSMETTCSPPSRTCSKRVTWCGSSAVCISTRLCLCSSTWCSVCSSRSSPTHTTPSRWEERQRLQIVISEVWLRIECFLCLCVSINSWTGSPCQISRRSSCSVKILQSRAASVRTRAAVVDVWCAAAYTGQQTYVCIQCCSDVIEIFVLLMLYWCVCDAGHTTLMKIKSDLDAHMETCDCEEQCVCKWGLKVRISVCLVMRCI